MVTNTSPIAQLVERLTVNQNVRGSSPRRGAKFEKGLSIEAFFHWGLLLGAYGILDRFAIQFRNRTQSLHLFLAFLN